MLITLANLHGYLIKHIDTKFYYDSSQFPINMKYQEYMIL